MSAFSSNLIGLKELKGQDVPGAVCRSGPDVILQRPQLEATALIVIPSPVRTAIRELMLQHIVLPPYSQDPFASSEVEMLGSVSRLRSTRTDVGIGLKLLPVDLAPVLGTLAPKHTPGART